MANLYYDETLNPADLFIGATVTISGDEARHAVRVARLRMGEQILIGNTRGVIARGEVSGADRDAFSVQLIEVHETPAVQRSLTLVQALAKGDRDERAIEQATEFGVDRIIPWQAERSVSRWNDEGKANRGKEKWQRIAREASKQSLRARVPEVLSAITTAALAAHAEAGARVLLLDPRAHRQLSEYAHTALLDYMRAANDSPGYADASSGALLVVGPEGGISEGELTVLEAAGAIRLRLGGTVLRTSSAGPAALAVLNVVLGRW